MQFRQGLFIKILGKSKAVPAVLQRPDGLLEGLLVVLADAHDFADCPHLSAKLVFNVFKFFKIPAAEFNNHVVTPGCVFLQGALTPVRNFIHGQPAGKH